MQKSISKKVTFEGIEFHGGKKSIMTLEKAPPYFGIAINNIKVCPDNVTQTDGMTTIGDVSLTEHILSTCMALGITNLNINVSGKEVPIMDGCSAIFYNKLKPLVIEQNAPLEIFSIEEPLIYQKGDRFVKIEPSQETIFKVNTDFPFVGKETYTTSYPFDNYEKEIAGATTFFYIDNYNHEKTRGKCKGVKPENCIVYTQDTAPPKNALAKHKLLDLVGDFGLLPFLIKGKITANKGGHFFHVELAKLVYQEYKKKQNVPMIDLQGVNFFDVNRVESRLAAQAKSKYCVSCSNGTDAIILALAALELPTNSKIAMPNYTFWATYEAIIHARHQPILIGVDSDGGMNLDNLKLVEVDAVLLVHLYGSYCNQTSEIRKYCKSKKILCVEDSAQAFGTTIDNKSLIGTSYLSTTSFYPTKILHTSGNGGAVFCNNEELYQKLKCLRAHGSSQPYLHDLIAFNFRMSTSQAEYLNKQLDIWPNILSSMQELFKTYLNYFKNSDFFDLIYNIGFTGYLCTVKVNANHLRQDVIDYLKNNNIQSKCFYPHKISEQPGCIHSEVIGDCLAPNEKVLSFPIYYGMTQQQQKYIISQLDVVQRIRVVLIGCGKMGKIHLKELNNNKSKFEVVAVVDPFVKEYKNYKMFSNLEQAMQLKPQAVIIASPTKYHYNSLLESINLGIKYILIEKPAVTTISHYNEIIELINKNGTLICIGLQERFNKLLTDKINQLKNNDEICRATFISDTRDIIDDLAIHDIDLLYKKSDQLAILENTNDEFRKLKLKLDDSIVTLKYKYVNNPSNCKRTIINNGLETDFSNFKGGKYLEHQLFYQKICGLDSNIAVFEEMGKIIKFIDKVKREVIQIKK